MSAQLSLARLSYNYKVQVRCTLPVPFCKYQLQDSTSTGFSLCECIELNIFYRPHYSTDVFRDIRIRCLCEPFVEQVRSPKKLFYPKINDLL